MMKLNIWTLLLIFGFIGAAYGAAGECKGGSRQYITYMHDNLTNTPQNQVDVEFCFADLKARIKERRILGGTVNFHWGQHGCKHQEIGNCRCTMDSSFIWRINHVFKKALAEMKSYTADFQAVEAETYHGRMYLSYTCEEKVTTPRPYQAGNLDLSDTEFI